MKTHPHTNHLIRPCLALAFALAIVSPVQLQSAEHAKGHEMKVEKSMMEKCEEMRKEKQVLQEKMKAQDAELTATVATMNSARQDKKLDLVADIVTQLVKQRTAMHVEKANMQDKMMKHMMGHMEMGMESMAKCPMMKDMKGNSADGHKGHQK